jgi:glycosyltransferase involved in cell wall biosynthesis
MAITLLILVILAAIFWIAIIILPIRPTATEQRLDVNAACSAGDLNAVTALIPARNEARTIALTLSSLRRQCAALKIVVIDDQSTDQTARIVAHQPGAIRLIEGTPTPPGWLGKVWALEQGLAEVNTPLVLLLDADIEMSPNFVVCLQEKLEREQLALVSHCVSLGTAAGAGLHLFLQVTVSIRTREFPANRRGSRGWWLHADAYSGAKSHWSIRRTARGDNR